MFQGVFTPSSAMLIDSPVETSKQNLLDFFEIISESQKGPVVGWERRNHTRVDYPHPVFLTPLDANGNPQLDETFGVLGRQSILCAVSLRGGETFLMTCPVSASRS